MSASVAGRPARGPFARRAVHWRWCGCALGQRLTTSEPSGPLPMRDRKGSEVPSWVP
jgi:hypothetical protein